MGQGIQVFNTSGGIVFDTSTKTIKVLHKVSLSPNASWDFTHPLLATDSPFYIITPVATGNLINDINVTRLSNGFRVQTGSFKGSSGKFYPNANMLEIVIGVY